MHAAQIPCQQSINLHQSMPRKSSVVYALDECLNLCQLVDPLELEVRGDAEGAALSSRTARSGAFCASKQHQCIMSSIQRHVGSAIRQARAEVFPHLLPTAKSFLQAVFNAARAPRWVVQQ